MKYMRWLLLMLMGVDSGGFLRYDESNMSNEEQQTTPGAEKKEDVAVVELDRKRLMDAAKFLIQEADKAWITDDGGYCVKGFAYRIEYKYEDAMIFQFTGSKSGVRFIFTDEEEIKELWRDMEKKIDEKEVEKIGGTELIAFAEKSKNVKEAEEKEDEVKKKNDEIDKELGLKLNDDVTATGFMDWLCKLGPAKGLTEWRHI